EIHLNEALEAIGVTPVETDLGEYIIQLAHERPSHIIAPAIHKTKGQVAELFSRELKRPGLPADPEVLTKIAREELREKFLTADLGITGANFAVAETGTVVLVTNEGNGRMATSLPRLPADRRPRVRLHVSGSDRHPLDRDAQRPRLCEGAGARLVALRRVRRRLPRPHRHSPDADRAAPPGRRGAHRAVDRACPVQD